MSGMPPGDDLRADPDVPGGIRYDPDLAVHEPIPVPQGPIEPSRRRSPLLLLPVGIAALCLIIYLLFGLIAHEGKRSSDYLGEIRLHPASGGAAAFELSRMLTSEDPRHRDARFVPDLLALFKESREMEDPGVRRYLALSLGELRDARAVDALEDALHDSDLQTRIYAVWSLGATGEAGAAPAILPLLSAEEPDLRKIAAYSLGCLAAPEALGPLKDLLNDPVDDVAWNAALALARQRDASGLPLLDRMLDRAYLDAVVRPDPEGHRRPLTEEQKEEAMINALRSIALLGDRAQIPGLRRIGDADPSLRVRAAAIESLRSLASAPSY